MTTEVFKIEGMSCSHCQAAVERAVKSLSGVKSVEVDLTSGKALVTYDPSKVKRDDIKEKIEEAGYEVI